MEVTSAIAGKQTYVILKLKLIIAQNRNQGLILNLIIDMTEESMNRGSSEVWGSGRDLNPGPRGPQPRALPG